MSMLKGNYELKGPEPVAEPEGQGSALEKEYYKAALSKLGGSIAFIMKDKTFVWTGDEKVRSVRLQPDPEKK